MRWIFSYWRFRLEEWFCRHRTMKVIRFHEKVVFDDMVGTELYIDRLNVHCFVACAHCGKVFPTKQWERLYEQRADRE